MVDVVRFVDVLRSLGVDFFTGVPDSLLKNFCAYVTDTCGEGHVIAANEGGAVGLAVGHYLATGKIALVYMQNSGQGNAVNPLCSLADSDVCSIPMVLLVGWRGEPGMRDEPQHTKQGKITLSLFETLDIPTEILPSEEGPAFEVISKMVAIAKSESRPVAIIVRKGMFAKYKFTDGNNCISDLMREEAIEMILKSLPESAVVVSTTGMISREVYETRERLGCDHSRDFLCVGAMGHSLMIALGIAKAQPTRQVVCLDGDGASIMQMGNMAIAAQSYCGNLTHIVLNNASHDSVGGQPTVGGSIDLKGLAKALGYDVVSPDSVLPVNDTDKKRLASMLDVLRWSRGYGDLLQFLEVRVAKGSRKNLGRPNESPHVNKKLYMKMLGI